MATKLYSFISKEFKKDLNVLPGEIVYIETKAEYSTEEVVALFKKSSATPIPYELTPVSKVPDGIRVNWKLSESLLIMNKNIPGATDE